MIIKLIAFTITVIFVGWALWILKSCKASDEKRPTIGDVVKALHEHKDAKYILLVLLWPIVCEKTFKAIVGASILGIIGLSYSLFVDDNHKAFGYIKEAIKRYYNDIEGQPL